MPQHPRPPAPATTLFLLLDGFTHLAFASAIEPLRLANQAAGRAIYRWRVLSPSGGTVACSNGVGLVPDGGLAGGPDSADRCARLVVIGGMGRPVAQPRVCGFIRRIAAHGAQVVGICGGVAVLAEAGLLAGEDCAVHWQARDAFRERFPDLGLGTRAFVAGRVPTAAGGAAAADLMLHLIARDHGKALATQTSDLMVMGCPRGPDAPQKVSVQARLGVRNAAMLRALTLMEENIETPLSLAELADRTGLSTRQVERMFARFLSTSPNQHYMGLRLARARQLLLMSDLPLIEVALACGFGSAAYFRKRYQAHFGVSAHAEALYHAAPPADKARPPRPDRRA